VVLPVRDPGALRAVPRGLTAYAVVFAAAFAAAVAWFGVMEHAGTYQRGQIVDTPIYQAYADRVADGQLPYRDFPVEYPPLAFAAFLPPRLVSDDPAGYQDAFSDLMGVALVASAAAAAAAALAAGLGAERGLLAGLLVGVGPAIAGSVALTRFDLWPVLLVTLALAGLATRSHRLAALFLGLAVSAKLWPAVLVPAALALAWRHGGRRLATEAGAVFLGATLLPMAVALALSPGGLWHALSVQAERPLQIESLGAAALVALWHAGVGGPYRVVSASGSQNLTGSLTSVASTVSTVLVLAALVLAWMLGVRAVVRAHGDGRAFSQAARFGLAAVVAGIALGHVLSPQFVLWLLPFPLLVRGARGWAAAALVTAALALTNVEFPSRYWEYARGLETGAATIVLARDLVLVALLVLLLSPAPRRRRLPAAR
jgi:hypothetical protein